MSSRALVIPEMRHLRVVVKPEQEIQITTSTSDSIAFVGSLNLQEVDYPSRIWEFWPGWLYEQHLKCLTSGNQASSGVCRSRGLCILREVSMECWYTNTCKIHYQSVSLSLPG
jgi:hypothetical protein